MDRTLRFLATAFLLAALMLSLFISLSLPYLPALDIIRVRLANGTGVASIDTLSELRLGIWGVCAYANDGVRACIQKKLGYSVTIFNSRADHLSSIKSSWTRGLVVHPIATVFILLAFFTSISEEPGVTFVAFFLSCSAVLVTLIAFIIDIALFALVRHLAMDINVESNTRTAPGFWLTLVSLILVILGSMTFLCGCRRECRYKEGSSYPMQTSADRRFWAR